MQRALLAVLTIGGGLLLAACNPAAPAAATAPLPAAPATAPPAPMPAAQMEPVQPDLARALNAEIDRQGARAVMAALDQDEPRLRTVGEAIATADPAWLTIALRLREGSDAGTGESLSQSLALALPNAPERVLALVGHGYTVGNLCSSPFIEPAPGVAEAYEARAMAALQSVTDPALETTVDECLQGVTLPK